MEIPDKLSRSKAMKKRRYPVKKPWINGAVKRSFTTGVYNIKLSLDKHRET